jgi:hypothetical protein
MVYAQNNPVYFNYYRIMIKTDESKIFKDILKEAYLTDEGNMIMSYQIVVNTDKNFIVIGEYASPDVEKDEKAFRYDLTEFSPLIREGLQKWSGRNKIKLRQ